MRAMVKLCACIAALAWAGAAEAQVGRGALRLSLDADLLMVAGVEINPEGPTAAYDTTVISFGLGQEGGSHVPPGVAPMSQLGLGVAWGISRRLLLGVRTALGLDVIDPDGAPDNTRVLAFGLEPSLTFVPLGHRAKLFIALAPLFQANRVKAGDDRRRTLLGGFSTGIGALIFAGGSVSVDLGLFFEGRFGGGQVEGPNDYHVRDLRGGLRFGVSLWR